VEPPPCLNTENCAGYKHYLSDFPYTSYDKAILLFAECKKKINADKKEASLKTLGRSGAMADKRDGQTAFLTAENLGVKVTVLTNTVSDFSAIPLSLVDDARKYGFPLKVEVVPKPNMLNIAIRGEINKKEQCDGDAHVSCDYHHDIGAFVNACSETDHCRRRHGSFIDLKIGHR
jgi:hypothetical protein